MNRTVSIQNRPAVSLAADLINYESKFGPLMSGEALWRTLGYPTSTAFAQARRRGRLPISVFAVPNRRGFFALTADVVNWLNSLQSAGDDTGTVE